MFKNQTPLQLSVYAALTSATIVTLLATFLGLSHLFVITGIDLILLFGGVFIIVFTSNFYFIRYYIFRKIKLIYKVIHRHKMSSDFKADKIEMDKNILDQVENEVSQWAEENDREIEELEKLASYRRRFIGDVSHELKTPIFNIQGFVHTLLDGALEDPEVNKLYLQRAARNIDRLQAIVEDLETINKLEAGQMVLDLREFDIHDLTDEVFADLEMRAVERNIRLMY
ncbi:MAG TPA: HAMP domain-containing sensor histidine kinase, partial [Saprospiraceae bacterium]|nr:HAMP domain-containing sensor histidine kinase [Saprospiraceae bacterium]